MSYSAKNVNDIVGGFNGFSTQSMDFQVHRQCMLCKTIRRNKSAMGQDTKDPFYKHGLTLTQHV